MSGADRPVMNRRSRLRREPTRSWVTLAVAAPNPDTLTSVAAGKKGPVFRVTGLPALQPDDELATSLKAAIDDNLAEDEQSKLTVNTAIVPSCYNNEEKVTLVEFHGGVPAFLSELMANPLGDWQVEMGDTDISFDQHFFGFTQLYTPKPDSPVTADFGDIILAHCLVKAVQTNEDDHPTIVSLHKAAYGMLLFGIPHKGLVVDDI
ncbi:hypothetical protein K469DRAFT_682779 [Zopfia rhizophila CBS 207.26]|uniref:Uncharacterized protein n=1 Tax=Zopfia rhizophila CBS 207.26 TaxID=1314779 RepID=A0A6A6DEW7_9PEZI|nr:hypothetical protein K469DRAFT_682779 [Zopfia rhizophila CBS 207.26]